MANGLSLELMESLASYSTAPELERRCLFVIATCTAPSELQQSRSVFNTVDKDHDGRVSHSDLVEFLRDVANWCTVRIDAAALFTATDLDRTGVMNFTKFAAACLHRSLAPLDDWLAFQAFESMDCYKEGLLNAQQVLALFGDLPPGLPYSQPFDFEEWRNCLLTSASMQKPLGRPRRAQPQRQSDDVSSLFNLLPGLGGCVPCHEDVLELTVHELESTENHVVELRQVSALASPLEEYGPSNPRCEWRDALPQRAPSHVFLSSPTYVAAG